jgi:hypothetical protein
MRGAGSAERSSDDREKREPSVELLGAKDIAVCTCIRRQR